MGKRRGEVHFADEELLLVPDEMPVGGVGEFVEDDMVRDACRDGCRWGCPNSRHAAQARQA